MADLNQETDFNQIIERLQTAVTNSGNLKRGIDNLSNNLDQINKKLQVISERINGILNDIRDREAAVQGNNAQIQELQTERDNARQQLESARQEMTASQQEIQRNIARMSELEGQLAASSQQEASLREQLARAPSPEAAAAIEQQLNQVMAANEDRLAQLGNEIEGLTRDNQQLNERIGELNTGNEASEARVQGIQGEIERLTAENNQLRQQITAARDGMISAIRILESITPENKQELTAKIKQTNEHIQEIEKMLGQGNSAPANQGGIQGMIGNLLGGPSAPEVGVDKSKLFIYNGNEEGVALKDIIQDVEQDNSAWADPVIKNRILNILKTSNDVDEIERAIERLETLKNIGHGGKTRKRRKTKRGKRTRKRRYRGGFQYSENTRRKKITTTGSRRSRSKRTSSRSRRTTSSIRTTSSF